MVQAGLTLAWRGIAVAIAFVGAFGVATWLIRPFDGGPATTDAAASVMYFDRIVAGQHLDAFVNTTPKPLLTLVYGGLHGLTGGWHAGAWITVLALAAGIVMASEAARRVAGREAAVFAAVALTGSTQLLAETSWGQGLPWAFAMWMGAGLALLRPVPRYGLAGTLLLVGATARPETLVFLAVATACLAWRAVRGPRPPKASARILIGWLALVVLGVHDLLLTGDPMWWTKVASISASGRNTASVRDVARLVVSHVHSYGLMLVAAVIGAIALVRWRSWIAFMGLTAMGPLVAALTLLLAARHLAVLGHYLHPIDLAIILSAAIGVGALLAEARRYATERVSGRRLGGAPMLGAASGTLAVLAAVILSSSWAPLNTGARQSLGSQAEIALRVAEVAPLVEVALGTIPVREAVAPGPYAIPVPDDIVLFGPRYQVNRLAVILGVSESRIRWLDPKSVHIAAGYPPVGSIVYSDGVLYPETVTDDTAILRPSTTHVTDGVKVVPIVSDPARKVWITRIEAADAAPQAP